MTGVVGGGGGVMLQTGRMTKGPTSAVTRTTHRSPENEKVRYLRVGTEVGMAQMMKGAGLLA